MGIGARQLDMASAGERTPLFACASMTRKMLDICTIESKAEQPRTLAPGTTPRTLVNDSQSGMLVLCDGLKLRSVPHVARGGVLEREGDIATDQGM